MILKRIDQFDNLNEGILSSLMRGIKNALSSKKGKLENVFKKIENSRHRGIEGDELDERAFVGRHAHARHHGDAHARGHHVLDGFQGGTLKAFADAFGVR